MIIQLQRDLLTPNETLGRLTAAGRSWDTIERPWAANVKGVSCVPPGEYRLERHSTEAHPNVWALVNPALGVYHWPWEVPKDRLATARTACLIHPANWASELRGCVAPGKARSKDALGFWMVERSRDAVNELRGVLNGSLDLTLVVAGAMQP